MQVEAEAQRGLAGDLKTTNKYVKQDKLNGDKLRARHVPKRGGRGLGSSPGIVTTCRIAGTWNTLGVEEVGELRPDARDAHGWPGVQRLVRKVSSPRGLRLIQGSEADARHGKFPLIGLIGLACARGGALLWQPLLVRWSVSRYVPDRE